MFTKQYYEAIAKIVKENGANAEPAGEDAAKYIAYDLAAYFSDNNPLFDKGEFLKACGLTD